MKDYTERNLREAEEWLRRWMPHFPQPRMWPFITMVIVGYVLIGVGAWWWAASIR
jgi:hypothetical protein